MRLLTSLATPGGTLVSKMVVYVSVGETVLKICQPNIRDRFRLNAGFRIDISTRLPYDPALRNCACASINNFFRLVPKIDAGGDQKHTILLEWPYHSESWKT